MTDKPVQAMTIRELLVEHDKLLHLYRATAGNPYNIDRLIDVRQELWKHRKYRRMLLKSFSTD